MPSEGPRLRSRSEQARDDSSSTKRDVGRRLLTAALNWAEPRLPDIVSNADPQYHSRRGGRHRSPSPTRKLTYPSRRLLENGPQRKPSSRAPSRRGGRREPTSLDEAEDRIIAPQVTTYIISPEAAYMPARTPRTYALPQADIIDPVEFNVDDYTQARDRRDRRAQRSSRTESMPKHDERSLVASSASSKVDRKKLIRLMELGISKPRAKELLIAHRGDLQRAASAAPTQPQDDRRSREASPERRPKRPTARSTAPSRSNRRRRSPSIESIPRPESDSDPEVLDRQRTPSPLARPANPGQPTSMAQLLQSYEAIQPRTSLVPTSSNAPQVVTSLFSDLSVGQSKLTPFNAAVSMMHAVPNFAQQQADTSEVVALDRLRQHQRDQRMTDYITGRETRNAEVGRSNLATLAQANQEIEDARADTSLFSLAMHDGHNQNLDKYNNAGQLSQVQKIKDDEAQKRERMEADWKQSDRRLREAEYRDQRRDRRTADERRDRNERFQLEQSARAHHHNQCMEKMEGIEGVNRAAGDVVYAARIGGSRGYHGRGSRGYVEDDSESEDSHGRNRTRTKKQIKGKRGWWG